LWAKTIEKRFGLRTGVKFKAHRRDFYKYCVSYSRVGQTFKFSLLKHRNDLTMFQPEDLFVLGRY
jgi:hypothetical protein